MNITIIKEHSINSESDVTFDMSPDSFSSPEDFLENLYKMNDKIQDKEKEWIT